MKIIPEKCHAHYSILNTQKEYHIHLTFKKS